LLELNQNIHSKKERLELIEKISQKADDSPYLSKSKKGGALKLFYMNIIGMKMSDEYGLVFERWATGFRKLYVIPTIDKV